MGAVRGPNMEAIIDQLRFHANIADVGNNNVTAAAKQNGLAT